MDKQPTIIGFVRGYGGRDRGANGKGMADSSDVWLGRPFRDDGYECAALTADFLDCFYHQIVCKYGRYPPSSITSSSFNGCFIRKCTDRGAVGYIRKCRPTFRRWMLQQKLRAFGVVLLDDRREFVAEFRVEFFEPQVGTKRWINDFRDQTDELNAELCRALIDVQNEPDLQFIHDLPHPPIFQVHCLLNGGVHNPNGGPEHRWILSKIPFSRPVTSVGVGPSNFNSSLASFRVHQLKYNPSARLSEFGVDSDDLYSADNQTESSSISGTSSAFSTFDEQSTSESTNETSSQSTSSPSEWVFLDHI